MSLAVAGYVDQHKHYPPAYLADARGEPVHSWRVLLLPFIEQRDLYQTYDFDQPWDGEHNRQLADRMPPIFALHGEEEAGNVTTNYLAVVGPRTLWLGATGVRPDAVRDGTSQTILLVENKGAGIHWMEPRDHAFDVMDFIVNSPNGISSRYVDPAVVMADCSIFRLTKDVEPDTVRALLTIDGGEKVQWTQEQGWHLLDDGRQRPVAQR